MVRFRSRAIAFASSAAFALLLASSLTGADGVGTDADHDGVPDNLEDATQRTVAVAVSPFGDAFNVSSHLGGSEVQDQFEFWYWAGTFGVYYGVKGGASITYKLEVRSLLEWKDLNGDGRMADTEIVRVTPLGSSAFGGMPVGRTERMDSDGGRVYNFAVSSRDRQVSLNVTIAERFTRLDSLTLTPMEARMDLRMQPNLVNPTAGVALEVRFETDPQDSVRFEDHSWDEQKRFAPAGEHAINVTGTADGRSASAFYSWANGALVSGQSTMIEYGSKSVDPAHYNLTFPYPAAGPQAGLTINHPMAFGINSAAFDSIERATAPPPPLQPDLFLFTGTFAGMAGLVAITVVLANRRRARHEEEGRKP
ncbi:MAG: hypothetical protein E6K19_05710 [Methanobacteriota archaeon]|nr:MAG: hypothetical protein E6K19_05710 [Euryarchaeota archaeon]